MQPCVDIAVNTNILIINDLQKNFAIQSLS